MRLFTRKPSTEGAFDTTAEGLLSAMGHGYLYRLVALPHHGDNVVRPFDGQWPLVASCEWLTWGAYATQLKWQVRLSLEPAPEGRAGQVFTLAPDTRITVMHTGEVTWERG